MLRGACLDDVADGLGRGLREIVRGLVLAFDPEADVEGDRFFHGMTGWEKRKGG
jgi:hypothetical protein